MTLSPERQKMIDKIVALLAKAESTEHEAEAATFRNKAGELMARYSIDYTDVNPDIAVKYDTEDYTNINPKKHELTMEAAVGRFNGIMIVTVIKRNGSKYIRLVGTRANIESHIYMMDLVNAQRDYAYNSFAGSKYILDQPVSQKEKKEWFQGFAYGVARKVWEILQAGNSKQQEWGLVVMDPTQAAQDWYKESHELTLRKSRNAAFNRAGLNSGKSVNLNRGVNTGRGSSIMIGA